VLQRDLENIKKWADKWKMEFNVDKCKVMHLGRLNQCQEYSMGGEKPPGYQGGKGLGSTY